MIRIRSSYYDFSEVPLLPAEKDVPLASGFVLTFSGIPARMQGELFFHSRGVRIAVCDALRDLPEETARMQNYAVYAQEDGSCMVLACQLYLAGDPEPWHVGFPLVLAGDPEKEVQIHVVYNGVKLQIFCNGSLMDVEYPLGDPAASGMENVCRVSPVLVRAGIGDAPESIRVIPREITLPDAIMYYTPPGFNTWVGDVVTYTFNDTFYIFYLLDRRHHGSRRGRGAHIFCMLTSRDLVNWVEHGPVFDLETRWQSVGTGTAFTCDGKLHLSYGWHTSRVVPEERCSGAWIRDYWRKNGHTGLFDAAELGDLVPGGGTYAVSEDGIHFTQSGKMMHYLENPSVFENPDGTFSLIQQGVWQSDHPGHWKLLDPDFPPHGEASFARNCLDCPNLFTLGDWEYLAVGFTGFFGRRKGDRQNGWIDFTARGWEPYDGLQVPMASPFRGRLIAGGWLRGSCGWGSGLLLRELLALGDGRVGQRWLPETLPVWGSREAFADSFEVREGKVMLEIPGDADRGILVAFTDADAGAGCFLRVDPRKGLAGFVSEAGGDPAPSFREYLAAHPEVRTFQDLQKQPWKIHFWGGDFTREQLAFPETDWTLRVILCRDRKWNGTVIDVEIAGKYTLATYRYGLQVSHVEVSGGAGGNILYSCPA